MIDFKSLNLRINNTYSFVGIERKNGENNLLLPKGFSVNDIRLSNFDCKRNLFFQFYKIIKTFKYICDEKGYLRNSSRMMDSNRDGTVESNSGSKLDITQPSNIIFYSKLDIIENFLGAYDELKVLTLKYRLGKSQKFDISKIHKYLHQAIYLPNNAAYIDEALLARPIVQFDSTDIVSMYCYLYLEIKEQLGELTRPEIMALAEDFRQHHLGTQDSIFDESTYERVLDALKEILDKIDNITSIKDDDYWQYYEAIELFLYGDWSELKDGKIWGISNFHSVWESMCLTHLVRENDLGSLLFVDARYVGLKTLKVSGFSDSLIDKRGQIFQLNSSNLVPDAVVFMSIESQLERDNLQRYYPVSSNSGWNDYGFYTLFDFSKSKGVRIGYIGQESGIHTVERLQSIYLSFEKLVDKPLDRSFYSFWNVQAKDTIDSAYLHKMYYFNHLFYVALKESATDWSSFQEKVLTPLSIQFGLRYNSPQSNVFTHSLLRQYCVEGSKEALKVEFESAMQRMVGVYKGFIEVIDIKYLTESYFLNGENIEDIKRRSVRKQFVYEYLLQKHMAKEGEPNIEISSSFWLPKSPILEDRLMETGSDFMDGYIQLKNINFMKLAHSYCS